MISQETLHTFFRPRSVAVVGASATEGKVGHTIMRNMVDAGFKGQLYPVNPGGGQVLGYEVVTSVSDLPKGLDMAVISIPRKFVLDTVRDLAARHCRSIIVITAGFKEVGHEGYKLEREIADICNKAGIALLGPNCLGMVNPRAGVNASFAAGHPVEGDMAFFSQSGALCVAVLDWALGAGIGFSKFISLGNKAALDEAHMLSYLANDADTKVILGYIENVEEGSRFVKAAREVSRIKPVIMIKSGTTAAGAKAASSHTGAIAGSDQAYSAAFRKSGVIRVRDVETLFDLAQAFANQPLPVGPNVAIVTNSGGTGILAADAVERNGLSMARLSPDTLRKLQEFLPTYAALYNPVDIIGDADAHRFRQTLEVVAEDPMPHAVLVMLATTGRVQPEETARAVIDAAAGSTKPYFACFMGSRGVSEARRMLREAGIPCYSFPEPAVRSIAAMHEYALWRNAPLSETPRVTRDMDIAKSVIRKAREQDQTEVVEFQAQEMVRAYNLLTPKTRLCRSTAEAVAAADSIGYPIVMKIASPDISHKSDVQGVAVGLETAGAVAETFTDMTSRAVRMRPDAYIAGCLVQQMGPSDAREVIVGFKRDDQFGPLLMFGLGGIHVEILKDIAFRLAPLSKRDAAAMVREIQSYMLLKGVDGLPPVDFRELENVVLALSRMAQDFPEILEAEFNPVLVDHTGAMVADVRMTLAPVKD